MSLNLFVWAAAIALAFVVWPILSSKSGAPGVWVGMLILIGSVIGNAIVGTKSMMGSPLFTLKALGIVLAAGIVNGIAVYYYGVKAGDPNVPTGLFVTSMVVFMAILAPFVDWAVKGTPISLQQLAGIAVIVVGIWLIKG